MWIEAALVWMTKSDHWLALAQLFAALVTAFATIALWRVTNILAVETKTLAKMTSHPFVVCALESSGADAFAMNLTLRNSGNATAFDVVIELDQGLKLPDELNRSDAPSRWEISLLPAAQALAVQGVMTRDISEQIYTVTISWADKPGSSDRETLTYRLSARDGLHAGWITKGPHQIAEALKGIRSEIANRP